MMSPPAPPTPTEVTFRLMSASSVRVSWQWTSSGSAPNCFNTTTVTYHPEGGGESSLQLSDPAATETTLTDLQCNTNYTITVVATAGEHRREGVAMTVNLPLQGIPQPPCIFEQIIWKWSVSNHTHYTSSSCSESWSHCRQHDYQNVMAVVMSRWLYSCVLTLLEFTINLREALSWCTQWTIQQQLVLPCPTCSVTQSTLSGFTLEAVSSVKQVLPKWFIYQQEVCVQVT